MMNPYPGLRYFEEADQDVFFGREEEIDQLLHRLAARRLVAVLRVSGCGKSSLIRAGLIPVLQSGLADPVSGSWRILKVFPGTAPLEALNRALGIRLGVWREHKCVLQSPHARPTLHGWPASVSGRSQ